MTGPSAVFAANLRRLRTAQRLSMEQLTARSGISGSAISKIEHGKQVPTLTTASMLAEALGTDLRAMLADSEEAYVREQDHPKNLEAS